MPPGASIFAAATVYAGSGRQPTLSRWIASFTEEADAKLCSPLRDRGDRRADRRRRRHDAHVGAAAERAMAESEIRDAPEIAPFVAMVRNIPGTEKGVAESADVLAEVRPLVPEGGAWHSLSMFVEGVLRVLMGDRESRPARHRGGGEGRPHVCAERRRDRPRLSSP